MTSADHPPSGMSRVGPLSRVGESACGGAPPSPTVAGDSEEVET